EARFDEEVAAQPADGGEVTEVPVQVGDVAVPELDTCDCATAAEELVGGVGAQAGGAAQAEELRAVLDVAAGGARLKVHRQHLTRAELEEAQHLGRGGDLPQAVAVAEGGQAGSEVELEADRSPGIDEEVAVVVQ